MLKPKDQIDALKRNALALQNSLMAREAGDAPNDPEVMMEERRDLQKIELRLKTLEAARDELAEVKDASGPVAKGPLPRVQG